MQAPRDENTARMKAPRHVDPPLFLRVPRQEIARVKVAAADLNMSVSAYARALFKGATPKAKPASDLQYLGIAASAIADALRLAEAGPHPDIVAALRQAKRALFENILVTRADMYDDAVVAATVGDHRWRSTTRTSSKT